MRVVFKKISPPALPQHGRASDTPLNIITVYSLL